MPKAKVKSRVILTPEHAKRLLLSLQENITRYESNVGKSKYRLRSAILPAIFRWAEVPRSVRLKVRYFRSAGAGRAVVLPKP